MNRRGFLAALAGGLAARRLRAASQPLYLLTYDHGGIIGWGSEHYAANLRHAVDWLERYPGFAIGLDNEAWAYDHMAEEEPLLLDELRDYLARHPNRLGVATCTYGQPLSQFVNEESNIRQLEYGLRTVRQRLGRTPPFYLMSEHAMHSQLPQLLAGFGFQGAVMRTHYMMYGFNPTFNAAVGWWVGADGTRLAAIPTYDGEGAAFGQITVDDRILTRCPGPECEWTLEEYRAHYSHIQPLLASRADDSALRQEALVHGVEGDARYRWVLLEDLPAIFSRPEKDLPTTPDSFSARMPWGYCGNVIWNRSRRVEAALLTAERLCALAQLSGRTSQEDELTATWKQLLVAQHHDIQICGRLLDADWFLGNARKSADAIASAALESITARMDGGSTRQIAVFNPSSWERSEWVDAEIDAPSGTPADWQLRRGDAAVPCAMAAIAGGKWRLRFAATPAPLGVTAYNLAPGAGVPLERAHVGAHVIANRHWRIRLHPNGGVESITHTSGRQVLDSGHRSLFLAGRIDGNAHQSRGAWTTAHQRERAVATEQGEIGGIPYTLELALEPDSPRIEVRIHCQFNGQTIGRPSGDPDDQVAAFVHDEKLRLKLFPALKADAVGVHDVPFAVNTTAKRNVEGNYWTALEDGYAGLAVFNRGLMGSIRESHGAFAVPLAFASQYIWGARWLSGAYDYELALWPYEGGWRDAGIHRRALEYNFPFVVAAGKPGDRTLGATYQPLSFASANVALTALYPKDGAVVARLWEHAGQQGTLEFGTAMREITLGGQERASVESGTVFEPWRVRTFRIGSRA